MVFGKRGAFVERIQITFETWGSIRVADARTPLLLASLVVACLKMR